MPVNVFDRSLRTYSYRFDVDNDILTLPCMYGFLRRYQHRMDMMLILRQALNLIQTKQLSMIVTSVVPVRFRLRIKKSLRLLSLHDVIHFPCILLHIIPLLCHV